MTRGRTFGLAWFLIGMLLGTSSVALADRPSRGDDDRGDRSRAERYETRPSRRRDGPTERWRDPPRYRSSRRAPVVHGRPMRPPVVVVAPAYPGRFVTPVRPAWGPAPSGWHPGTTSLDLSGSGFPSIGTLPPGLTWLDVSNTPLSSLAYLPQGLRFLRASDTPVSSVAYLPGGLTSLDVSRSGVDSLAYLPPGLRVLNASETSVSSVSYLPAGLLALDVSYTDVTQLVYLPTGLQYLDARGLRISSLAYLPSTLGCVVADAPWTGPNVVRRPCDCRLPDEFAEVVSP